MNALRKEASYYDVCIAKTVDIPSSDEENLHNDAINELLEDDKAKVVICFCEGLTARNLLIAIKKRNLTNRFLFLGRYATNSN